MEGQCAQRKAFIVELPEDLFRDFRKIRKPSWAFLGLKNCKSVAKTRDCQCCSEWPNSKGSFSENLYESALQGLSVRECARGHREHSPGLSFGWGMSCPTQPAVCNHFPHQKAPHPLVTNTPDTQHLMRNTYNILSMCSRGIIDYCWGGEFMSSGKGRPLHPLAQALKPLISPRT